MLLSLYVENVAIIKKISLDFENGFAILTGETGAGKSILIDSIGLLLGNKSRRELIGVFSDFAFVKAGFTDLPVCVLSALKDNNISPEDGVIFIERKINKDGRSTAKINGVQVTIAFLQSIAPNLINIHGQHDNILMLNPDTHIEFLDRFAELDLDLAKYNEEYKKLRHLRNELQKLQNMAEDRANKLNQLTFKLQEFDKLQPYEGMQNYLIEKRKVLQNQEKIKEMLSILQAEGQGTFTNAVQQAMYIGSKLVDVDKRLQEIYEHLSLVQQLSDSILAQGNDILSEMNDSVSLEQVEEQLFSLEQLLNKYAPTEAELLIEWENTQKELENIQSLDLQIEKSKEEYLEQLQCVQTCAAALSEKRMKSAELLSKKISDELSFLDMSAVFEVTVDNCTNAKGGFVYNQRGYNKVEFMLSSNVGQPLRPLSKIASGGELSRIMLSLSNILNDQQQIGTLIFDEIDTGVSGKTAQKIGKKLKDVSRVKQVLCITHLAQIASLGNSHFKISKSLTDGYVETDVKLLDEDGRVEEISRIIGGIKITETVRSTAREMLSL